MKTKIILAALVIIPFCSYAQTSQKISGKVLNETGSTVDGYNVVLLSPKDTSIYKGDFFMEPEFSIETNQIPVLLKITSIGFRDTTFLVRSAIDRLPDIRLTSINYTLDEVVVKATQPMIIVIMRNKKRIAFIRNRAHKRIRDKRTSPATQINSNSSRFSANYKPVIIHFIYFHPRTQRFRQITYNGIHS